MDQFIFFTLLSFIFHPPTQGFEPIYFSNWVPHFNFTIYIHMLNTRFFYKNILYKNIEAQSGQKIKNILRIC